MTPQRTWADIDRICAEAATARSLIDVVASIAMDWDLSRVPLSGRILRLPPDHEAIPFIRSLNATAEAPFLMLCGMKVFIDNTLPPGTIKVLHQMKEQSNAR